jgi:hypothetical protein
MRALVPGITGTETEGDTTMKHSFVAAALISLISISHASAGFDGPRGGESRRDDRREQPRHDQDDRRDGRGDRDHDHHHHHDTCSDRGDCDGADLAFMSSSFAISLSTQAADDDKLQIHLQAAEDAAVYLETGRMTGTLAALVSLAREKATELSGADAAAQLSESQLVDGLLAAAEQALDRI